MPGIFICYRRDDSAGFAGRLYDRLEREFGKDHIFMDVDASIKPGDDFVKVIDQRVNSCDVLIALIGKRWLTARKGRKRRIEDPLDYVRLEIETALKGSVRIVPALLEGAGMPSPDRLPDSLSTVPRLQAVQITHERFGEDANRLIATLGQLVEIPQAETPAPSQGLAEPARAVEPQEPAPEVHTAPVTEIQQTAIVEPTVRTNSKDGLEYVWIPPGTFQMGAVEGDDKAEENEKPQHRVTMSKGFWLGRTPVAVAAYKRFVKETRAEMPEALGKGDHPVVNVSWDKAVAYCQWAGGRLPSEAEWEYAARGRESGLVYPWGNSIDEKNANYYPSDGTSPVGSYPANGFGLDDMAGNVWEWCSDWYDTNYYSQSPDKNPQGPSSGTGRVLRGGSWVVTPEDLRASYRRGVRPDLSYVNIGFRCAREVFFP